MSAKTTFQLFTYSFHIKKAIGFLLSEDAEQFGINPSKPMSPFEKKNEIFRAKIWKEQELRSDRQGRGKIKTVPVCEHEGRLLFKIGCEKQINLPDDHLVDHHETHYPYVYVYFDNRPSHQILAIGCNPSVFSNAGVLARVIQDNANTWLSPLNLECTINPQFDQNDFWKFVKKHPKTIDRLQFLVLAPNLPRISASVPEAFQDLQRDVNSQSAKIDLQSSKVGHLTLNQDNAAVAGLAKAAADGGGEIMVRIKGVKRLKKMRQSTKEVAIADIHAEGNPAAVLQLIKTVLNEEME